MFPAHSHEKQIFGNSKNFQYTSLTKHVIEVSYISLTKHVMDVLHNSRAKHVIDISPAMLLASSEY